MLPLTLSHLVAVLTHQPSTAAISDLRLPISTVVVDSRQVEPGAVFVALPGERTDGHSFVTDALRRGAVAAIVEQDVVPDAECWLVDTRAFTLQHSASPPNWPPTGKPLILRVENSLRALQAWAAAWRADCGAVSGLRVVGITGSVGKTSTKESVASVLAQRFSTLKSMGNQNNEIGVPLTLLRLTTSVQRAVLEMGMYYPGDIALLARLARPNIGVITNVGPVHLERAGSIERIAQAKAELVEALPAAGVAILNRDDPLVMEMAARSAARVFTYGLDSRADLWADEVVSEGQDGIRFVLHYAGEHLHIKAPMLGRHSVHTALRAAAVGLIEGLNWQEIVEGLQDVQGQLRLVVAPGLRGITIIDDTYSASPAATLAALNLLADLPVASDARRIAVLGDMLELGDHTELGHRKVGQRAADVVAKLVTVGPLARLIADEALNAGMTPGSVAQVDDNAGAVTVLRGMVQRGDLVLVKGSRALHLEEIVASLSRLDDEAA
ncbi:UDP-N-acetylmuramoyl-tripeptide--D-alanyl-D-alanine ligase [Candidatus Amarolinea aalborgensis]|jgi:UDP-N-acetylmuramoyl-tripeptide--D-alanyl-D-alanine ligase|uniref:UDP-N-acetylmuramoyl-tripeptide--D-alanyl-D- alanine ligase n=1 Tax=Candidatus Amarolinea aalborgensis TaxID=2249329 RepID=UPI003BF967BA